MYLVLRILYDTAGIYMVIFLQSRLTRMHRGISAGNCGTPLAKNSNTPFNLLLIVSSCLLIKLATAGKGFRFP